MMLFDLAYNGPLSCLQATPARGCGPAVLDVGTGARHSIGVCRQSTDRPPVGSGEIRALHDPAVSGPCRWWIGGLWTRPGTDPGNFSREPGSTTRDDSIFRKLGTTVFRNSVCCRHVPHVGLAYAGSGGTCQYLVGADRHSVDHPAVWCINDHCRGTIRHVASGSQPGGRNDMEKRCPFDWRSVASGSRRGSLVVRAPDANGKLWTGCNGCGVLDTAFRPGIRWFSGRLVQITNRVATRTGTTTNRPPLSRDVFNLAVTGSTGCGHRQCTGWNHPGRLFRGGSPSRPIWRDGRIDLECLATAAYQRALLLRTNRRTGAIVVPWVIRFDHDDDSVGYCGLVWCASVDETHGTRFQRSDHAVSLVAVGLPSLGGQRTFFRLSDHVRAREASFLDIMDSAGIDVSCKYTSGYIFRCIGRRVGLGRGDRHCKLDNGDRWYIYEKPAGYHRNKFVEPEVIADAVYEPCFVQAPQRRKPLPEQ